MRNIFRGSVLPAAERRMNMLLAKVKGTIVSTSKNEKLVGYKLLIVEVIKNDKPTGEEFLAVDGVGAGIGEKVIVATGSAARLGVDRKDSPVDAAIVGIVDEIQ